MLDFASETTPANLLWTGGWDSTFQLLQLLIVQKVHVTPFYLIDEGRRSIGVEILTMKQIKDSIFEQFPDTRERLNTTQYFAVSEIAPNARISEAFHKIRQKSLIGSQYDWLARFCEEHCIDDLQLCIHKCIHQNDKVNAIIRDKVKDTSTDSHSVFKMGEEFSQTDEYSLFKYFSFPIFNLTKPDMAEIAKERGLDKIMEMTWFCHNPREGRYPCGKCNPCLRTMEEGLGWRIPVSDSDGEHSNAKNKMIRPFKALAKKVVNQLSR